MSSPLLLGEHRVVAVDLDVRLLKLPDGAICASVLLFMYMTSMYTSKCLLIS